MIEEAIKKLCNKHAYFNTIITQYGPIPSWKRSNTFETLAQIIIEQQVSLASAKAVLKKLKNKLPILSAETIITCTDDALKACSISRQKISYLKSLANHLIEQKVILHELELADELTVRKQLIQIKGIGIWSCDVYLMMVLQQTDIFPIGDVALKASMKHILQLQSNTSDAELLSIAETWKPYRTAACYLFYWEYLHRKNIPIPIYT